jgi:ribose 5-phosphate isomerase B
MSAKKKTVYIGSDHAGFDMKEVLNKHLAGSGYKVFDMGCGSREAVDYPDIAAKVCAKVVSVRGSVGILICGTGIGMMMAANKKVGIRAADCTNELMARMARLHNNANILCLGSRIIGTTLAEHIARAFLETDFEGEERHKRRIRKIMCAESDDCC